MPRRRRRSLSPVENLTPDDEEDSFTNEDLSPNRCPPQQRNAANARERARMRVLSKAFCRLKTTLPWVPADTKLSKLDTLRLASGYIAHLRAILADQPPEDSQTTGRPLNLTWPFTFQQGVLTGCSPDRGASPRVSAPPENIPQLHHQLSNCDINMYNSSNNNNCFTRSAHYQQTEGYYGQIQRDNAYNMRNSYSDSMLHTG